MTTFTIDMLREAIEEIKKLEDPMIESFKEVFSDNGFTMETHLLVLPKLLAPRNIPSRINRTVLVSPHIRKPVFINRDFIFDSILHHDSLKPITCNHDFGEVQGA